MSFPSSSTVRRLAAVAGAACLFGSVTIAAEILHSDGRRETVKDPRPDSKGRWMAEIDGHRTPLIPGEVVVIVDDAGKESVTIPELTDGKAPPAFDAVLAKLRDPKNADWMQDLQRLPTPPSRGAHDAFVALGKDASKEMRRRGVNGLAMLRTKESVMAASDAVLAEKDKGLRKEIASALFSVQEIFKRCDNAAALKAGMADKDGAVRVVYAMLAPADSEDAKTILRSTDGLQNSDHHVREMAALELGERGDGAGTSILVGLLARNTIPGVDVDKALMDRMLTDEQVAICKVFGKLGTPAAKAALEKAKSSRLEAVRKAAAAALAS